MNFKLKIFVLSLLFILCVNSVHAVDSLNNMPLEENVVLGESNYVVDNTILIDRDVSITSDGGSTILANNTNSIFNISANGKLTLSNLNLTNGKGINGGAIYNNGILILNNCSFKNNKASFGGAIYNNGTLILNNCYFGFNTASVSGGAIYNLQDGLTIKNSVFTGNYLKIKNGILKGGAIANYADNFIINNCSFINNGIYNTYWYGNGNMYGGAIYNIGNNFLVLNSKFGKNYIYGYTNSSNKHVDLSYKFGGAVYSNANVSTFINNEFDSNEIYSMLSSYVSEKIAMSNGGSASVISAYNKVILLNNTFLNNSAATPPVRINNGKDCLILNNTFINNNARSLGQSIWIGGDNTVISGNIFYRNENATDKGYFANAEVYEILIDEGKNNIISYNYFENSNGIHYLNALGGDETVNLTIVHNLFNNSMNSISLEHINNATISSNIFLNSTYAISTYTGRYINIKDNYFYGSNCKEGNSKGYVSINSHYTTVSGNVFKNIGSEKSSGSIIAILVRDNITITNNAFIENTVAHGKGIISSLFGGYYYIEGITDVDGPLGIVEINNNYFANNSLNDGAIFESSASKINIERNILENNDGLLLLGNDTYYSVQYVNFTKNQIKDFNGNINDYIYLFNPANFDGSNNEKYNGDSSSFLDKILNFTKNLLNEYFNSKNSFNNSTGEGNNTSEGTNINNTLNGTNNTDSNNTDGSNQNKKHTSESNSTDVDEIMDSNVGNILDEILSKNTKVTNNAPSSTVGISNAGSVSASKIHEIEKSNVSKKISDNNYLIWVIVFIIVICALFIVGYKKK